MSLPETNTTTNVSNPQSDQATTTSNANVSQQPNAASDDSVGENNSALGYGNATDGSDS